MAENKDQYIASHGIMVVRPTVNSTNVIPMHDDHDYNAKELFKPTHLPGTVSPQWLAGQADPYAAQKLAEKPASDPVNHPSHYKQGNIEVIDFIEDQKFGYLAGQVVKYVARARHKGSRLEDYKKAEWYLKRLIGRDGRDIGEEK